MTLSILAEAEEEKFLTAQRIALLWLTVHV